MDQYGGVLLWNNVSKKDNDWCEEFLQADGNSRKLSLGGLYPSSITPEQVVSWYEERIREIERLSGIISHSLDLTRLGTQRNITVSCYPFARKINILADGFETILTLVRIIDRAW